MTKIEIKRINEVNNNMQKADLIKKALKIVDKLATLDVRDDEEIENLIYETKKLTKHRLWKLE